MSLNKSATRRFSLLAGSSLVAASLAGVAFTGLALTPTLALAANECAPVGVAPSDNGATADAFACTGATAYQATGISYSSDGALTVNATGAMNVGAPGIDLDGNGADNVTFATTAALTGTSGAVVDVTTAAGDISVTTFGIAAGATGVTHAVKMESTGGGDITFLKRQPTLGVFNLSTNIDANAVGGAAAISAITNGGNIDITINTGNSRLIGTSSSIVNGMGAVRGRERGILAQTSGAGRVKLTINGYGVTASEEAGIAAVDVIAGTGGVDIDLNGLAGGKYTLHDPVIDALAIRVVSNSAVSVDNTRGLVIGAVDFSGVTAGGLVFDNFGDGLGDSAAEFQAMGGRWIAGGASIFTSQNDMLRIAGYRGSEFTPGTTIDFGAGSDIFNMSGSLVSQGAVLSNLETFNNSGSIYLGGTLSRYTAVVGGLDGNPDDVLSLPGTTFTGSGASRLYVDVILDGTAQIGCEVLTGAADCLDLRDGTAAGSTVLTINDASPTAMLSGYVPSGITLVDVSGSGASAAGAFTLDPASTGGYVSPLYGAAIERPGGFVYLFRYDAENQRHVLISQPKNRDLFDYAMLSGAAQSIWHLTSGTVNDRQADLRGGEQRSMWLRTAGEVTRRDATTTFDGWDGNYTFDNSYNLYTGAVVGGADLLTGAMGDVNYALGVQAGYVSSSFDLDETDTSGRFTGATGGVYGALWNDRAFLNGTINVNGLTLDHESSSLGSSTTTYVNSVGAQAEAGVRARLTEASFAEPLLTVSWVRTSFEEISLSGGEVQPADAESLRAALGMRLGSTLAGQSVSATYFVAGRAWYEFEGESGGLVHNAGADLPFADEFTGGFGEAQLGVSVANAPNTLSGFLTSGVKVKDGYSAVNLSLGVRLAW